MMRTETMLARPLLAAALICASPALAAEAGGCASFKWPIEADRALLVDPPRVDSGATLEVGAPLAVRVLLVDAAKAGFTVSPERASAPGAPAGTLHFQATAGTYQFTVTDRVWLDVAQNGRVLEQSAFSGAPDCDGARKSMRFELGDGPATLQLSGSPARTVAVAIRPAP